MYYFKQGEEKYSYIDVKGTSFVPDFDHKVRVELSQKEILSVYTYDEHGEFIPIKKSSDLRKKIFNALQNQEWGHFVLDNAPIDGFANEDGEEVSYMDVLFTHKEKKVKVSIYQKYNSLLTAHNMPVFKEQDVIRKQVSGENIHIYYRIEDNVYHVCINEFDYSIVVKEKFMKVI